VYLKNWSEIRVVDSYTLQVVLDQPDAVQLQGKCSENEGSVDREGWSYIILSEPTFFDIFAHVRPG